MKKQTITSVIAFLLLLSGGISWSQNNSIYLDGAYIVLNGGTQTTNIYVVVDQPNPLGIIRPGGGHIVSEGQYNYVKWDAGTSTGSYVFPFGLAGGNPANYIPFTFNKTTASSSDISVSTWTSNSANVPWANTSNVPAVSNMNITGTTDLSVPAVIDRWWDIQAPAPVTADLTFSYFGTENTTTGPTDPFKAQHWNGASWDPRVGPGNAGVTTGVGTVGPVMAQSTFSPWILSRATLSTTVTPTQNVICNSQCKGIANVTASGGTLPYTYSWITSPVQTTVNATGLCAGTYSVIVSDANSTSAIDTVTITQPIALSSSVTPTNLICNGQCIGSATLTPTGGTPSYSYSWNTSPVQTTANATGLCAGTYSCTVMDANNCPHVDSITITQPVPISIAVTSTNTGCTTSIGTATANPNNGTAPYSYNWNNGQIAQTATGLGLGNYTVTVTDANGCSHTQTVTVTSASTLTVTTLSTPTGCSTGTGTATANPSSGVSPYTYNWSNAQTAQTATGLIAGTYTVTVTDANGCTQTQTAAVTTTPGPTANVSATSVNIVLGNNTQLTATGVGTYSWSPTSGLSCSNCANPTATPSSTTNYCVMVTDANSCTDNACIVINVEIPCQPLYIPNAFSPNNDGDNDVFYVVGNCIKDLDVIIFNRWGEKVYEITDPTQGWDGYFKGKLENSAVFDYYMKAMLTSGEKVERKGNVSLVR